MVRGKSNKIKRVAIASSVGVDVLKQRWRQLSEE